mgnify:CR=1 FL=1
MAAGVLAVLKDIHRTVLPDGVRLTVDLDSEISFYQEEIENPRRVFFDLKNVKAAASLQDASLKFDGDLVKLVRLGRHPQNTTRLVVDLDRRPVEQRHGDVECQAALASIAVALWRIPAEAHGR